MKLIPKLSLLACLAPISIALASNPPVCIKPEMLYQAAVSGVIHDPVADYHNHNLHTKRFYTVGVNGYAETMPILLDKNHHWQEGPLGYQAKEEAFCEYYDKDTNNIVDLEYFYILPGNPLRK